MEKKRAYKNLKTIILYVAFFALCCFILIRKQDYFVDELLTYNLANAEAWFCPEDGRIYTPAARPLVDSLASDGIFDLKHVWSNQASDTHPPFYYLLVHAICVFFPGSVSMRYAGIVNIVFIVFTLFIYRKIVKILVENEKIEYILSVAFCVSSGILSIVAFLRMYVVAMFFVTAFSYLIIKKIEHFDIKSCLILLLITVLGALTHYYFILFAFFASLAFVAIMLLQKRFKEFLLYTLTMAVAGGITYLIFPAIIKHLFIQGRGAESIENLKTSNFVEHFKYYSDIINSNMFGGLFGFIILLLLLLILLDFIFTDKQDNNLICHFEKIQTFRFICLLFPIFSYVIFVSKSAPYIIDRYISPIYAVLIASVWCLLYVCLKNVYSNTKIRNVMITGLVIVVTTVSLLNCSWTYLYPDRGESLKNALVYGNASEAIVLYDVPWKINPCYKEIEYCNSSVFYNVNTYSQFCERIGDEELPKNITFFLIGMNSEEFINEFLLAHTDYSIVLDNGEHAYAHSYYLKK